MDLFFLTSQSVKEFPARPGNLPGAGLYTTIPTGGRSLFGCRYGARQMHSAILRLRPCRKAHLPEKVCLRVQSERLVAIVAVFESRLLELVEPDPEFPALGRIHIGTIIASILSGTGRDLGKILSVIATGVRNIWSPRAPGGRGTRVGTTCCAHFKRD